MNAEKIKRFLRVMAGTLLPVLITMFADWSNKVSIPVMAMIAGAIQVAYRKANPLDGTSQAGRFIRVALFTLFPQIVAIYGFKSSEAQVLAVALTGAMEVAWRDSFPGDGDSE